MNSILSKKATILAVCFFCSCASRERLSKKIVSLIDKCIATEKTEKLHFENSKKLFGSRQENYTVEISRMTGYQLTYDAGIKLGNEMRREGYDAVRARALLNMLIKKHGFENWIWAVNSLYGNDSKEFLIEVAEGSGKSVSPFVPK